MNQFYETNGMCLVELPRYNDGTYAYLGDYFIKDGKNYKIVGIDYRNDHVFVWGVGESDIRNGEKLSPGDTLTKPNTKLEKIKEKLLGIEWTREQAVRACELMAEAFELGKEVGQRGN